MRWWLVLGLLLAGCDCQSRSTAMVKAAAVPGPAAPKYAPNLRRQVVDGLVLRCAHVLLSKDEICGVLSIENTGKEAVAWVDRWNSWGAYQWRITIGPQTAVNPQVHWWANYYSETALAPGEVRHAWFTITWLHAGKNIRQGAWHFDVRKPYERTVDENWKEINTFKPFESGQTLILLMQPIKPITPAPEEELPVAMWTGIAVATSTEVEAVEDLESLAQGQPLH